MTTMLRAAVKTGIETTEIRTFPRPAIADDAALLRVEAAGVGGSDPEFYRMTRGIPAIMGHENVGVLEEIGPKFAERWGVRAGDRIALQEYLPCHNCELCRQGDFRLCAQADFLGNMRARRFGQMDCEEPPHLWGGFAQYMYLPANVVMHRIPADLPAHLATLAVPLGNGWQWAVLEGGVKPGHDVLVFGPGQQGLGCVIAAKTAGASQVILAGHGRRDRTRLDLARELGADHVIDSAEEDLKTRVLEITQGRGIDIVVDTTGDTDGQVMADSLELAKKGAQLNLNGLDQHVPLRPVKVKSLIVRTPRGRSHQAVELALKTIASRRLPLERMCSHVFALDDVHLAIMATAGRDMEGAIHVVVDPWK